MNANFGRYFEKAVTSKSRLSYQLLKILRASNEAMPGELCKALELPAGATYSQGIERYIAIIGPKKKSVFKLNCIRGKAKCG